MRKCLVIAYYFPPMGLSGVQRTLKFVKYLKEYGWEPIVLTTSSKDYYAYDESLASELEELNIQVFRTNDAKNVKSKPSFLPNYGIQRFGRFFLNFFNFPDSKAKWKKYALSKAERIFKEHDIDVIFATAPPFTDFLIAKELAAKHNIQYVLDYRDSWIDNKFHYFPTLIHKSKAQKLEAEFMRTSFRVIVISRQAKENLIKRYKFLSYDDIIIIPHGYDQEDFDKAEGIEKNNKHFVINHSGVFQDDRTPKYFFLALKNIIKKQPELKNIIRLQLVGLMRKNHLKMIKKYKLEEVVESVGFVNHKESIKYLISADLLWLMLNDNIRTPGKLWEYFGAKKPILATIPDGPMKKLCLEYKSSIITKPKDEKEIEKAVLEFYELWKNKNLPKPDENFVEQFDRKGLTEILAKQLSLAITIN